MEITLPNFKLSLGDAPKQVRKLSDMRNFFSDKAAVIQGLKKGDPIIYEVYAVENDFPGGLCYAVTVINPGDIAGEYYMTKGHFHQKDAGEIYIGLEGKGMLILQNRKGEMKNLTIEPGKICYVPGDFAHRSVNTGKSKLKFLAVYTSESGYDYATIEKSGFKEKVIRV